MDKRRKILITSVGSNVGGNILLSLAHRRDEFFFIGTNSIAESAFAFMCDETYLVPKTRDQKNFISSVNMIIAEHKPDIILAGRDQDVDLLARLKIHNGQNQCHFAVPSAEVSAISNDKFLSYQFACRMGLPFAPSAIDLFGSLQLVKDSGYPLIAKPRYHGHASRGVFIIRQQSELELAIQQGDLVIQSMIGDGRTCEDFDIDHSCGVPLFYSFEMPEQISGQALVGHEGEVLCCVASYNRYAFGRSNRYRPIFDDEILSVIRTYADRLGCEGHFGPLNLQGRLNDQGKFVVYEINMRFTGATEGRSLLGWNEVESLVDYCLDGTMPDFKPSHARDLIVTREPSSLLIPNENLSQLIQRGHWSR